MRLFLLSRLKDKATRDQLDMDDKWMSVMSGGKDLEIKMRQEYEWLRGHNPLREYMFVCVTDSLNDTIPW